MLSRRGSPSIVRWLRSNHRFYYSTPSLWEEKASVEAKVAEDQAAIKLRNKLAARDFNNRRAAYNRQVTKLRRQYQEEVQRQRAADKAEQEALERELTRRRLERQRIKNIRSAQNALRQEELRKERAKEFEEHLEVMQMQREAKDERFAKARQLVIDELEEEAPLWLTTPEEVEAAFTPEAEQLLWARPGGVLGAPAPSLDSHFWQYETHTWHMNKTYKSMREMLLEELEEMAYVEANVDKSIWTDERLVEQTKLEEKARLRAMVHSAGRTQLLRKQQQMLDDVSKTAEGDVPKPSPVPNLTMLQNDKALEEEGAKVLMEDPTKFFMFESDERSVGNDEDETHKAYSGPPLGPPIGLRDTLREGHGRPFPFVVGKTPKPDTRTEREKKLQEREERMLAAAQAESSSDDLAIELASKQQSLQDLEPDLDYDALEFDSDDEEWTKGLDPIADAAIINIPRAQRYKEDDIDWVLEQLGSKRKHFEQQFEQDVVALKRSFETELRRDTMEAHDAQSKHDDLETALLSLSSRELIALSDLDDRLAVQGTLSDNEIREAIQEIPGLTEAQVRAILGRVRES